MRSLLKTGVYLNPCTNNPAVNHPSSANAQLTVYNPGGIAVLKTSVIANALRTTLNTENLQTGMYYIVWPNGHEEITMPVVKKY